MFKLRNYYVNVCCIISAGQHWHIAQNLRISAKSVTFILPANIPHFEQFRKFSRARMNLVAAAANQTCKYSLTSDLYPQVMCLPNLGEHNF